MKHIASLAVTAVIMSSGIEAVAVAQETEISTEAGPEIGFEVAAADTANWRAVDPENLFIFETTKGRILIEALPNAAPGHVTQFRAIIRSGDYDGTSFHRVIEDFMAQGGNIEALKGRDSGLPDMPGEFVFKRAPTEMVFDLLGRPETTRNGYYMGFPMHTHSEFLAEMTKDGMIESWIPHCASVVSTARTDDPNSANSQFFLMRGRAEHLDRTYTAWGRIIAGQDAVLAIKTGEPVANPDILQSAHVAADLPEGERPQVLVQRTDGPAFAATLTEGDDVDVCDLPPVPAVVAF